MFMIELLIENIPNSPSHLAVFFLHHENGDFPILMKDILIENIPISPSSKTTCQHVFCWATQPYSVMLDLAYYKPNQANSLYR
jgi:hypothetical protein